MRNQLYFVECFLSVSIMEQFKPKTMGITTYRASKDMQEQLRNTLPDIEKLKILL